MAAPTVDAAPPTIGATRPRQSGLLRGIAAGIASVLATILVVLSVLTLSTYHLLFNTDRWVAAVAPLAANVAVQDQLSTQLADQIVAQSGVSTRLESAFPQQPLISTAITSAAHDFFQHTLEDAFASDAFHSAWEALIRAVHPQVIAALRGDPSSMLAIHDDTLYLDTSVLVARGMELLRQRAPRLADVIAAQPDRGAAEPVAILQSDRLSTMQAVARILDVLVFVLPIAAIALIAATLFLATHRARMLAILGAEVALGFMLLHVAVDSIQSAIASSSGVTAGFAVVHTIITEVLRFDVFAVVVALLALVAGLVLELRRAPS